MTLSGGVAPSSSSFTRRLAQQRVPLPGVDGATEPRFQEAGQREIEIVAAQNQMVAYRHAVKLHAIVVALPNANQRKVGRPAANITDQDLLTQVNPFLPVTSVFVNPGVERRLRLFDQCNPRKAGFVRGFDGQFSRHFIERCRKGEHDVLVLQRLPGVRGVPGFAQVTQESGADFHRTKSFHIFRRVPGENLPAPVDTRVA